MVSIFLLFCSLKSFNVLLIFLGINFFHFNLLAPPEYLPHLIWRPPLGLWDEQDDKDDGGQSEASKQVVEAGSAYLILNIHL